MSHIRVSANAAQRRRRVKSVSLQEIGDGSARASEREDGVVGSAFLTAVLM